MSFFQEDVETVWVTSNSLVNPEDFPNAIKEAILYAIFNNEPLSNHILAANIGGFQNSIEKLFQYGKLGDDTNGAKGYYLGLPEGTVWYGVTKDAEIKKILEDLVGEPVTMISVNLKALNHEFYALHYIQSRYYWNYDAPGIVYSTRPYDIFQIVSTELIDSNIRILTRAMSTSVVDGSSEEFTINISMPSSDGPWYQFSYRLTSEPSYYVRYGVYDITLNAFPSLNPDSDVLNKEYYPISPIRVDHVNTDDWAKFGGGIEKSYDTASKMTKKIGVNLDELIEAVSSPENTENLDDISDAYFIFGIDVYTKEQASIEYLYEFFKEMDSRYDTSQAKYFASVGFIPGVGFINPSEADTTIIITKDSLYETQFEYNYTHVGIGQGVIAPVGEFLMTPFVYPVYVISNGDLILGDGDLNNNFHNYYYIQSFLKIYKQINDTQYIEVRVDGLIQYSHVRITGSYVLSQLTYDSEEINKGAFFIPVNRTIVRSFSGTKENLIMYDAMRVVVYSVHVESLKWYASSGFRVLINIVSILVGGYYFGKALVLAVGSLTGAAATAAMMTFVGKLVITAFILDYTVNWILENIGGDLGLALAIGISIAVGMASGTLTSTNMLTSAMKVVGAVSNAFTKQQEIEMLEMHEEYSEFLGIYDERMDSIEDLREQLEGFGPLANPLMMISKSPSFNLDQTPEQFYAQKLQQNPGAITLRYPELYYAQALKLPEMGYDNTLPPL